MHIPDVKMVAVAAPDFVENLFVLNGTTFFASCSPSLMSKRFSLPSWLTMTWSLSAAAA